MDQTLIPSRFQDVTPSDTAPLGGVIGLYVGGAGNVRAAGSDGVAANFAVQAGGYLVGRFRQVLATGTTATGIVAQIEG